jgi:predicted O-linked N-acetylglucosamine transferase (SPINDLY family)
VVLDTFPYNGATTTMETLWMGIPIVTKVGQQFAARNSYTLMMNAGITEGIAWSDAEYIDWGVRLGNDAALRQQVRAKLWLSRKTSPLWNGKQFVRELELAYEGMWQKFLDEK